MDDFERIIRTQLSPPIKIERILSETLPEEFTAAGFRILRD